MKTTTTEDAMNVRYNENARSTVTRLGTGWPRFNSRQWPEVDPSPLLWGQPSLL